MKLLCGIISSTWSALPGEECAGAEEDTLMFDNVVPSGIVPSARPASKFVRCEARLTSDDPFKVPIDGLCMYHCVAAATLGPDTWSQLSLPDQILRAKEIKQRIVAICRTCGDEETANRLNGGNEPVNYPGIRELKYFVTLLDGAVHVVDAEDTTEDKDFTTREGVGEPL